MKVRLLLAALLVALLAASLVTPLAAGQEPDAVQEELEAAEAYRLNPAPVPAPAAPPVVARPAPEDIIYFSDFEGDDGGLVGSLDWEWGTFAWNGATCDSSNYPPPAAYSGTDMWGTVLNSCYNNLGNNEGYNTCINENPADDSIVSFSVDLSGVSAAELSWWEWFDLFLEWDWAEVRVNDQVVFQHCGGGFVQPTQWEQQVVDLTPFAGGVVDIEFHMLASTVVNHAGWYIDDVMIYSPGDVAMHVGGIGGHFVGSQLRANALVLDETDAPVPDVEVLAKFRAPGWPRPYMGVRLTNPNGMARFAFSSMGSGSWKICVEDLAKTGYTYNPGDNVITCKEWIH
jgi:ABC-type amino acid transport substrate-binding protein